MGLARNLKRKWRKLRGVPTSPPPPPFVPRRDIILRLIDPARQRGLEIGPLCNPLVTKDESNGGVYYVDWATAAQLRAKYRDDPAVNVDAIVETDYLWGRQTLPELVAGKLFDYVIASHVIEHAPNMIGWLREIAATLRDDGILSLAIPDKRYTFDVKRQTTSFAALVEAYLLDRRRPSIRDVFEHTSLMTNVAASDAWAGSFDAATLEPRFSFEWAWAESLRCKDTDDYVDVHVTIVTPATFLAILEATNRLGLLDFSIASFSDTRRNDHEFFVALQRTPRHLPKEEAHARQRDSIASALATLTATRH